MPTDLCCVWGKPRRRQTNRPDPGIVLKRYRILQFDQGEIVIEAQRVVVGMVDDPK